MSPSHLAHRNLWPFKKQGEEGKETGSHSWLGWNHYNMVPCIFKCCLWTKLVGWDPSWAISHPKRWCCESAVLNMSENLENSAVARGLEKISLHSNPKKGDAKECSNYHTIPLISHASKVMLNILQARLQQYMNCEIPDAQAGFRKGRGSRDQTANIRWIIKKSKRVLEKHLFLLYWLCQSLWLCGSQ